MLKHSKTTIIRQLKLKKVNFFLLLFVSAACFAEVPQWIKNPEKIYPTSKYIRAIGEGTSIKSAQTSAIADIALFFNTKIDVITTAVEEMKEISSSGSGEKDNKNKKSGNNQGEQTQFFSSKSLQQITNISSTAEFFGVKFTDAYYDKKSDKYSVLGYIDKNEASQVYISRIDALMQTVNSYRVYVEQESEPFLCASALANAIKFSDLAQHYIDIETIIFPAEKEKFQNDLNVIAQLPVELAAVKKQMTFSIIMNQNEKRFDPLFSCVSGVLESKGCSYSVSDSEYQIIIDVSCIEENYESGPFVRSSIDVLILNNFGNGVYSYSKAFPRIGSTTMEQAYTRTITKIRQDLEENLLAEF